MAQKTLTVHNGAAPGAAALAAISTGTAIKTQFQIATNATAVAIQLTELWCEFDGSSAATPIKVEFLRHTGGAQTSLTAYVAGDIAKANDPNAPASTLQLGTALSGFGTGAAEVTPTTVSNLYTHYVAPTAGVYFQFPLSREPEIQVGAFLRHRTTAGSAVNCISGCSWTE